VSPRIYSTFGAALLTATVVSAQTPAAPPTSPAAPAPAAEPAPAASESPAYTYDPQGRRDPFVSLLKRGVDTERPKGPRAAGIAGLEASEVVLKGTMQSRTGYVALVEATDRKTYIVKSGDRLRDGTVRSISADMMVILQQVTDPLALDKQREVRKTLRQTDEVK
jgi:type IV pilus assembly protein PilP